MRLRPFVLLLATSALLTAMEPAPKAVNPAYMNRAASPCKDFYAFACGAYDAVPIPGDYSSYGVNEEITERNSAVLKEILEDCVGFRRPVPNSPQQRIGDFFASGMDEGTLKRLGLEPLKADLARIEALRSPQDLAPLLAHLHRKGVSAVFSNGVGVDDKDATRMTFFLFQGGLGLPEREFYFRPDAESQRIREAYQKLLARLLHLSGEKTLEAARHAKEVMALETKLAQASRTLEQLRDPERNYNAMDRPVLAKTWPRLGWQAYFKALKLPEGQRHLVVGQPDFFKALEQRLAQESLATWRTYLKAHLLLSAAPYLDAPFEMASFEFYQKTLGGQEKPQPRWKRVLASVDEGLGFDLGQLFVAKAFSPQSKARVEEMVRFHKEAIRLSIQKATWMGEATKVQALKKLETLGYKVGYPTQWRDYRGLAIHRNTYLGNVFAAHAFEYQRRLNQLLKPVDKGEWSMTPQTNNAYYEPTRNEIVLPAGILQPPFFVPEADEAENYGALASTIGHELMHGFDDQGCQYDGEGNLKNWWTEADKKTYEALTDEVVKQYDAYEPLPGLFIHGRQTLGENLADIGGLKISFEAYRLALAGKALPDQLGLTADQRFFVAFAQGWRTNQRPETLRTRLGSDVHSPVRWRVIGPARYLEEFATAFKCPTEKKKQLW
ncbi:MAG: M13 family metallopeptidase [Firmicutes bacterium]|nr:M13 family metallopeptidase [Bacillota bacterium]